jgi:hypothetical protein
MEPFEVDQQLTDRTPRRVHVGKRVFGALAVFAAVVLSVAIPHLNGMSKKARAAQVISNLHTIQLAAESYATDTAGNYARTVEELRPYFPGGGNEPRGSRGVLAAGCVAITIEPKDIPYSGERRKIVASVIQKRISSFEEDTPWVAYCGLPEDAGRITSYIAIAGRGPHVETAGFGGIFFASNQ